MIFGLERRIRAAEGFLNATAPARTAADDRVEEALAKVPPRLLYRLLALADTADDDAAADMLATDAELELALDGLMELDGA